MCDEQFCRVFLHTASRSEILPPFLNSPGDDNTYHQVPPRVRYKLRDDPLHYPANGMSQVHPLRNGSFNRPVRSYLICSVLTLLFCCWPLGLVALIYSLKSRSEYRNGLLSDAVSSSSIARTLNLISLILGILFYILICLGAVGRLAVDAVFCSKYPC